MLTAFALAGCGNAPAGKPAIVGGHDYEYVTPLGSNIPVLVKKGQRPATASPTDTVSADQAASAIHGAGGQIAPIAGQKS